MATFYDEYSDGSGDLTSYDASGNLIQTDTGGALVGGGAAYGPTPVSNAMVQGGSPAIVSVPTDISASIFSSISSLGSSALLAFGPKNSGVATVPHYDSMGRLINPTTGQVVSTGPSMTEILLFAAAAVAAIFFFGKMR